MVYELIATLAAAFGLAGIALIIKHILSLMKITAPRWLVPLFAAIGIFTFQIHQEYNWYDQTASKLPKGSHVVNTVTTTSWFRPWSYVKPQTVRFIAMDKPVQHVANQYLVNLYLFERRMSTKVRPQLIDCDTFKRSDYVRGEKLQWFSMDKKDLLIKFVCTN